MKINTSADGTYMRPDATEAGTPLLDRPSRIVSWMSHEGLLKSSVLRNQAARERHKSFDLPLWSSRPWESRSLLQHPEGWDPDFGRSVWPVVRGPCLATVAELPGTSTRLVLVPKSGLLEFLDVGLQLCHSWQLSQPLSCEAWGRNGRFLSGLLVLFSMTCHNQEWLPVYTQWRQHILEKIYSSS